MRSALDRMIFNQFAFIFVAFYSISFFGISAFFRPLAAFLLFSRVRAFLVVQLAVLVCVLVYMCMCVCMFILATNFNVVVADFLVVSFIFTQHRRRRLAD